MDELEQASFEQIIDNIAEKLEPYVLGENSNMDDIKTSIRSSLEKSKEYLNHEVIEKIIAFVSKMEIKVVTKHYKQENNPRYVLMFELHDIIGFYFRDSSTHNCNGIRVIQTLIRELIEYINKHLDYFTYNFLMVDAILKEPFRHTKNIYSAEMSLGEGLSKSVTACYNKARRVTNVSPSEGHTAVSAGGSKSRRRHRRKPARKTRRGRTRKSKATAKAKSKTHRRRHHSRVRKNKKNTYTRRR